MKVCTRCKKEKEFSEFYYNNSRNIYNAKCIECVKKYYQDNKEARKKYYHDNKKLKGTQYNKCTSDRQKYMREYMKEYYQKNKIKLNKEKAIYKKRKRKKDPIFKLKENLRHRIGQVFKVSKWNKNNNTSNILGCDYETAHAHLERQFTNGMNWSNQGEWHIDHIIPLASAKTEKELIKLCHYTNLQPLWAEDNIRKSDKMPNVQTQLRI